MNRKIQTIQPATLAQDGAGVKLKRLFPMGSMDQIDPCLLLDNFGSDNVNDFIVGFPMHPHRGIETVTYMIEGSVKHSDSTGHSGTIEAGDVQWMRAGRGIMHEEMPERANGKLDGLQLWVNLSSADKMKPPEYQEYKAKDIPSFQYEGHTIRLVSGDLLGKKGVVKKINTQPIFADIKLHNNALTLRLPETHNAFIYVLKGSVTVLDDKNKPTLLQRFELGMLGDGKQLVVRPSNDARIILVAGKPIGEPIARSGPFVMNTQAEIMQVYRELQAGTFPPD